MKTLSSCVAGLALFFINVPVALAVDAPGWIGPAKVDRLYIQPNGNAYVQLSVQTLDLGCTGGAAGKTSRMLQLDTDAPLFYPQYALLLSAQMKDRDVQIYVNGCDYYPYAQNTVLD